MIAVDTNLLVRFLVRDDPRQAKRARDLVEQNTIYIVKTVLLETEWVMRYSYDFERAALAAALEKICGLPQVVLEDKPVVKQAIDWYKEGFDFGDALHLATSQQAEAFSTFDRNFIKKARNASTVPVLPPP